MPNDLMSLKHFAKLSLVVLVALTVRWSVSLNNYSGFNTPPMYGDYEAQRHWMEITLHLPPDQWYQNSSHNDLLYWGLDYPPLTAYHSWLCGLVAHKLNSSWVELGASQGIESSTHKLFMRYTVMVADVLLYFPAVIAYFFTCSSTLTDASCKWWYSLLTLLYPGLMLIDHGHFQYNCVSLGLTLWGVVGLCRGHDLLGSAAFVLALNYKQMELYHAMPFFCYLLGSCFRGQTRWFMKLAQLGLVVMGMMVLCWLPFLGNLDLAKQVLYRIFPFARGLYEDKVANVWCTLSVFIKLKQIFGISTLLKICLGSTLAMLVPSSLHLLWQPSFAKFRLALVNASLIFFLFSFQVHEKSILLTALPVCLVMPEHPFVSMWFLMISTFSMLPLLIKDQLVLPSVASCALFYLFWTMVVYGDQTWTPQSSPKGSKVRPALQQYKTSTVGDVGRFWHMLFWVSMFGAAILTLCSLTVAPPAKLPDLFAVLVSAYACMHFLLFLVYFHWQQFICCKHPKKAVLDVTHAQPARKRHVQKKKKLN